MRFLVSSSILLFLFLSLQSFKPSKSSYKTECVSLNSDAYIDIYIWNVNKKMRYKQKQASMDAIHAYLFSGVAASSNCGTQSPVLQDESAINEFKKIEHDFFMKNGDWKRFIRSIGVDASAKVNINNCKVYQVSISKKELRAYLESKNIIHQVNKGF
jgi:hypothetical protein